MSNKVEKLSERVDEIARKPEEEQAYQDGLQKGVNESARFYRLLPFFFQQTISEYLNSIDWQKPAAGSMSYPSNKEEAQQYWRAVIEKETEQDTAIHGFLVAGKGNTEYECPNCGIRYYSGLLMAYHQFDKHAIQTRNDERGIEQARKAEVTKG